MKPTPYRLPILAVFVLSGSLLAQQEMTMKDYNADLLNNQKKEQVAKEKIAEEQAAVSALKDQVKETGKQTEKTSGEVFTLAGTTPEGLDAWKSRVAALQTQLDAFNALAPQDKLAHQSEVPALESQVPLLKQDKAFNMPGSADLVSATENTLNTVKAAIASAQQDIAAAAANAKLSKAEEAKQKIEAAKAAKEEAKRKAEEERQAKQQAAEQAKLEKAEARKKAAEEKATAVEARKQAKAEAKQKAEADKPQVADEPAATAASADPGAGLDDIKAGAPYKVKNIRTNRQTLSKMALKLWGDAQQWTRIYDANKRKIEKAYEAYKASHPGTRIEKPENFIFPGEELSIPQ